MAAQTSLLPVYHNAAAQDPKPKVTEVSNMDVDLNAWMAQEPALQDEAFLQELLSGQGDDLLSTLLGPAPCPTSTSIGAPLTFDFDTSPSGGHVQPNLPNSPVSSVGCSSDNYSVTNGGSPLTMNANGITTDTNSVGGVSPQYVTESPNQSPGPFISSALPVGAPSAQLAMDPSLDFNDFGGVDLTEFMTSDVTISGSALSPPRDGPPSQSSSSASDVRIDVEPHHSIMRGSVSSDVSAASPLSSSHSPSPLSPSPSSFSKSDRKAATLLLTDEEKKLLAAEGVNLPTDMPLTKAEQKQLKRVQRKIKNKISAQESRKRKKNYVDGLEERVKICTERNQELKREVDCLRSENQSLLTQLKKLQTMFLQYNPSKVQAGTVAMVLILSFSLFLVPRMNNGTALQAAKGFSLHSRSLLFTEADEFGNVIDPETGRVISPYGGQSPSLPFPWVYQTPAAVYHDNDDSGASLTRGGASEVHVQKEALSGIRDTWSTGDHQEVDAGEL